MYETGCGICSKCYGGGELKLERFTDSSFQSDIDDSKSISGFIFCLNDGTVS